MKKVALSAAILALAMMGCSDVGLDNSVASSNEETSEQTQSNEKPIALLKTLVSHETYNFNRMYTDTIGSYAYYMHVGSGVDALNQGSGTVWVERIPLGKRREKNTIPDYLHMVTACVQGCDDYGNCNYSAPVAKTSIYRPSFVGLYASGRFDYNLSMNSAQTLRCESLPRDRGPVGVVSYFAVVFNAGQYDEVILQGLSSRNLNEIQTIKVSQDYIMPTQN